MQNLKSYLDKYGFPYSKLHKKAKSIFFPVSFDKDILRQIKDKNGAIIQRLDGVYYPSKHGEEYIEHNKDIKDIYLNYSSFIIFQSRYSKKQCFAMFGEKREDEYTTILNGVNKNIFYPAEKKRKVVEKVRFVTTGNFRNIDMIEPVVKALDTLKDRFNFELAVVGPIKEEISNLFDRDYIIKKGKKTLIEVADILRTGDIFIYSHLNPPCPNSVIEAVSCGLPVVGFNSGAMTELLFFTKDLLADVSDDVFQRYEYFDYMKLAEKIILAVEQHEFYQEKALENSHLYSFEECGVKYLECFKSFQENKSFKRKI
jgi:glycosyltransferase involved in cell wall biosynthesis